MRQISFRGAILAVCLVGVSAGEGRAEQGQCNIAISNTGMDSSGRAFAQLSYSVSFSGSPSGGYSIGVMQGPQGTPDPVTCAGGSFVGHTSGTCRWLFQEGGVVRFSLSASAGGQQGGGSCTAASGAATLPSSPPPSPFPSPTPGPSPSPTPTPAPTPPPPGTGASCYINVDFADVDASGTPYVQLSYSVGLSYGAAFGGYGLTPTQGPQGTPSPSSCGGGSFVGHTSGTCQWIFQDGGEVEFTLSASGGGQQGSGGSCTATTAVAIVPPPGADPGQDRAVVSGHTLPGEMRAGATYGVTVTMTNTGESTWSRHGDGRADGSRGYKLAVKSGDLIPVGTRYELPDGVEVRPGHSHTFEFTIAAPNAHFARVELQMIHERVGWFGRALSHSVQLHHEVRPTEIVINPVAGPPGTVVSVALASGPVFPEASNVLLSFGDPEAHSYSLVPVDSTRVSASLHMFVVPAGADCGTHYVNIGLYDERLTAPAGFVVTAPCDPGRRAAFQTLSYNVALVPLIEIPGGLTKDSRAGFIPNHSDLRRHDIVIFEEAFSDSHRATLRRGIRSQYPYQSGVNGNDHGLFKQDGGVFVASKWPIQAEAHDLFHACSAGGLIDDDVDCGLVKKGVKYVRIDKAGQIYHVFGTHFDAGEDTEGPPGGGDVGARRSQLWQMRRFIDSLRIPSNEPVILGGDFNIDLHSNNGEYGNLLSVLDVTHPQIISFPFSNPRNQWLDYVLYWNRGLHAENASNEALKFLQPFTSFYLSDHFAVKCPFVFPIPQTTAAACAAPPASAPLTNGPTGQSGSSLPEFSWEEVAAAASYTVEVFDAEQDTQLIQQARVAGTSVRAGTLVPPGRPLYWRVRAENACGRGPESAARPFQVEYEPGSPPAAAPVPIGPGGRVGNTRPTFLWSPVDGATSYEIEIVAASDGAPLVRQAGIVGSQFTSPAPLPPDVDLAWSIRGVNASGPGPDSLAVAFMVDSSIANESPTVTVSHSGSCGGTGCSVTFTATAADPENDALTYMWFGCNSGSGVTLTCTASHSGAVQAGLVIVDRRGGQVNASTSVQVHATAWQPGAWGSCTGSGGWTCTSGAVDGCTRPGTQTQALVETAWSLEAAGSPPEATRTCVETTRGYATAYTTGPWGSCSRTCGGGTETRTVTPIAWQATAPAAPAPAASRPCNTQPCPLTCYSYPDHYVTRNECLGRGWPVCERRFRDDGRGGTLTCWKGFN